MIPIPSKTSLAGQRLRAHAFVIFILWPLATIIAATVEAGGMPYYGLPYYQALAASALSLTLVASDFILIGLGLLVISLCVFGRFNRFGGSKAPRFRQLCIEAIVLFVAIFIGTSVWYPTVLSHALLVVFWPLPTWLVLLLFMFVGVTLIQEAAPRGRRARLALVVFAAGVVLPMPSMLAGRLAQRSHGSPADLVLLGLDSLSQTDDVARMRQLVGSHGGAWYEHAVAPSLVTNAVWSGILTMQPVRQHGIFNAFQSLPPGGVPVLNAAKHAGYRTVSVFPDQLTCAVGTQSGFDEDRSGPVGWRQLALATIQNSSILLPLFRPLLPWMPWSDVPPNQAGTFTYDLEREVREILMSGLPQQRTFVAAHLTYLHIAAYPRSLDLDWHQRLAVAVAPAGSVRDRSFDWQDTDLPTDALALHRWKTARLQSVVAAVTDSTRFVERGGRMVLFSDHGERAGLTPQTFTERKYHHVLLASFGLPRRSTAKPISLLDIAPMVGLGSPTHAADPVVEFAIAPIDMWSKLGETSSVHWSGTVDLDPGLLQGIFEGLREYRPWLDSGAASGFQSARVFAADARRNAALADSPAGRHESLSQTSSRQD